jgi:hypothetical protein
MPHDVYLEWSAAQLSECGILFSSVLYLCSRCYSVIMGRFIYRGISRHYYRDRDFLYAARNRVTSASFDKVTKREFSAEA